MTYSIEFTGLCLQGLVRKKNEDNLACGNKYLPIIHTDDWKALSGSFSSEEQKHFAVFDGIGGESCGEVASFLAAGKFAESGSGSDKSIKDTVNAIVHDMNEAVCLYAEKNHIRRIGCTVASLFFSKDGIYGFNIGDSRCYRFSEGKLFLLSDDHVVSDASMYKGSLTQCLGTSEKEFRLDPSIYSAPYKAGDIFLLCTDGLTKMISDKRITRILNEKTSLQEKLRKLNDIVLRKGAVDNTTIIMTETTVHKRNLFSFMKKCGSWLRAEI